MWCSPFRQYKPNEGTTTLRPQSQSDVEIEEQEIGSNLATVKDGVEDPGREANINTAVVDVDRVPTTRPQIWLVGMAATTPTNRWVGRGY